MKKTIIALLALSGLAVAAPATLTTGSDSHLDSVIATAQLTPSQLTSVVDTANLNTALIGVTDSANNSWSAAVSTWGARNELLLYTKKGGEAVSGNAQSTFTDSESWPAGNDLKAYFGLENAVMGAITLGYQGANITGVGNYSGTAVVFSVLYNDGSVKTAYGLCSGYKYSNNSIPTITYDDTLMSTPTVTLSTTPWTKDSLIGANLAAVPEPTTATLSLLALAGLAARRRRK